MRNRWSGSRVCAGVRCFYFSPDGHGSGVFSRQITHSRDENGFAVYILQYLIVDRIESSN